MKVAGFKWNPKTRAAALALAEGKTREEVAKETSVSLRTIYNWLNAAQFSEEVDRLSLMTGVSSRAARLRITKRVVEQMVGNGQIETEKDLLDWLKYAQSETDGIKLDIAKLLATVGGDAASVAGGGQDRGGTTEEGRD